MKLGAIGSFLPLILICVLFYFMLILPERKRKKQYDAILSDLKVNDEIMTRGGVIGKIVFLEEENMVIETSSDRTKIKFSKSAVANKIYKDDKKKEDK